jgi:hypothetical protein
LYDEISFYPISSCSCIYQGRRHRFTSSFENASLTHPFLEQISHAARLQFSYASILRHLKLVMPRYCFNPYAIYFCPSLNFWSSNIQQVSERWFFVCRSQCFRKWSW